MGKVKNNTIFLFFIFLFLGANCQTPKELEIFSVINYTRVQKGLDSLNWDENNYKFFKEFTNGIKLQDTSGKNVNYIINRVDSYIESVFKSKATTNYGVGKLTVSRTTLYERVDMDNLIIFSQIEKQMDTPLILLSNITKIFIDEWEYEFPLTDDRIIFIYAINYEE